MAQTINELVRELIIASESEDTAGAVRLAESDREDQLPYRLYHLSDGNDDQTLQGASGFRFRRYVVVFCSEDASQAEAMSETFSDYINSLAVNHTVDDFVIQSAVANDVSDEDKPEIVSDVFLYAFTKQLTLAIGRAS